MRRALNAVSVAAVFAALVATGTSAAAQPSGTWSGRIVPHERSYTVPTIKLVISGHTVNSTVTGLTGAAHDAPTATTSCLVTYKLIGTKDGWSYYEQAAPSKMSAAGYVEAGPCGANGDRRPGRTGYQLRVHPPQGGKLTVQIREWEISPKSLADDVADFKEAAASGYVGWRGFLTR
jgi:hypothetical protein